MLKTVNGAVGEWKTYTSKRNVTALAFDRTRGTVWAATTGGLFSYRTANHTFSEYTTSEGLLTVDLSSVALDNQGNLWIGATNGYIHRFNYLRNEWQYVMDIALGVTPQKRINHLSVVGDTLYVLSDVGLSLFSISRMEFIATYLRFGPVESTQLVGNVTALSIFNDSIWVGTRNGIAATSLNNPNSAAPESWRVFTTAQGLPSNVIVAFTVTAESLCVATDKGLAVYSNNGVPAWNVVPTTAGLNIVDVVPDTVPSLPAGSAFFVTPSELWKIADSPGAGLGVQRVADQFPSVLTSLCDDSILGTSSTGILVFQDSAWVPMVPPGPPSNKFAGIAVDQRGVLWAATGSRNGEGFMSFDGNRWRSYTVAEYPQFRYNDFFNVSIGTANAKWIGNWGGGVALLDDTGAVVNVYNTTNGLLGSVTSDTTYVVVGGVAADRDGVTWITNRTPPDDIALVRFKPDSTFDYNVHMNLRQPTIIFTDVVIDENGTKWFANFNRFETVLPSALYYYNERYAPPGTTGGWGRLTTADGLISNQVWSLAVDRSNELWIGSEQGITIIYDLSDPRNAVLHYYPLPDQVIQGILVDPLNNKWIATRHGVFVLSSDGTTVLNQYTPENTNGKLIDSNVTSIAMNEQTGTIYFGTENGLSTLRTAAIAPNRTFDNGITISPNPYYVPSATPVIIDGLVEGSSLKILTVDGTLVRQVTTPGGRIGYWDGTNNHGELVATAVYIVVAYSEDGSKAATGKIAVVRR